MKPQYQRNYSCEVFSVECNEDGSENPEGRVRGMFQYEGCRPMEFTYQFLAMAGPIVIVEIHDGKRLRTIDPYVRMGDNRVHGDITNAVESIVARNRKVEYAEDFRWRMTRTIVADEDNFHLTRTFHRT